MLDAAQRCTGVFDACNLWQAADMQARGIAYHGIGRGRSAPSEALIDAVVQGFRAVETGVGNEVASLVAFLNRRFAADTFNEVRFDEVRRIAATCVTGCEIAAAGAVTPPSSVEGFASTLAAVAARAG